MKIIGTIPEGFHGSYIAEISQYEMEELTGRKNYNVGDKVDINKIYRKIRQLECAEKEFDRLKSMLKGLVEMVEPMGKIVIEAMAEEEAKPDKGSEG